MKFFDGYYGLYRTSKGTKTGENQQEYIRVIEKSSSRMLNIIDDIVSISKIESGQINLS
jgi:signal transduction histidine kinase